MYVFKWHNYVNSFGRSTIYDYILGFVFVLAYVIMCTHKGHGTRRWMSGVKNLIRHQNYRSSFISTNTPSANLPYVPTQYPYPATFPCLILILSSYCTSSPCPLTSRVGTDLTRPLGRSPTSQSLTTHPRS